MVIIKPSLKINCCFFIALSLSITTWGNEQMKDNIQLDPYNYIVDQLCDDKIVMLGDFQHSSMLPHMTLIRVLNNYVDSVLVKKKSKEKVTLILELSPEQIEMVDEFVNENHLEAWFNDFCLSHSLEDIYLLEKLRSIKERFGKHNSELKIKGFEDYFTEEIFFLRSEVEKEKWFVKERDSLVFERATKYIKENPDENILFYYGIAHLLDGAINKKSLAPLLDESECTGHFLAYYLKKKFGKENVMTFNQLSINPDYFVNSDYDKYKNMIFMVDNNDTTINKLNKYNNYYDYTIVRHEYLKAPTPLRFILSNNVLKACYNSWSDFENWNQKYKNNLRSPFAMEAIGYISGKYFQNVDDFGQWIDTNKTTLFDRISSQSFSKYLFSLASYDPKKNNSFRNILVSIGFGPGLYNLEYIPTSEEWNSTLWPAAANHVKYLNAVGLLWVGNDNEKIIAKKYIYDLSKLEFQNPSESLEWWYARYCNYTFL